MSDQDRRKFWSMRMDEAFEYMQRSSGVEVRDCMERLVHVPQAAKEAAVPMTFSSKPHILGLPRLYHLREGVIKPLLAVANDMASRGWVLHIEDALRTRQMQKEVAFMPLLFEKVVQMCEWETGGEKPSADLLFRRMAALIASWPKVAVHMGGSAVDISVFDKASGAEIDRGAPYLEMSELTPMDSPFVSVEAQRNRQQITEMFARHGFTTYPFEFWHYDLGDVHHAAMTNSAPARYGPIDWNQSTGAITPAADMFEPFNSPQDMINKAAQVAG